MSIIEINKESDHYFAFTWKNGVDNETELPGCCFDFCADDKLRLDLLDTLKYSLTQKKRAEAKLVEQYREPTAL